MKTKRKVEIEMNFATLLAVLFIGLKLAHIIDWPWIWVLCPLWLGLAVFLVIVVIAFVITLISSIFK